VCVSCVHPIDSCFLLIDKGRGKDKTYVMDIYECRCDERLKPKGIYTSHIHWEDRGTGTPKNRDEVNKREFFFIMSRERES
jgi:hypothetical protein